MYKFITTLFPEKGSVQNKRVYKLYIRSYSYHAQDSLIIFFIIKNPVDSGEVCPGPSGNITQYQISFQTGSFETVNIARCTAKRCKHTFEPAPNPPSSYDIVSVAAKSVVGVGDARTCTTQLISELHMSPSCCKSICTSTVCLFYVAINYYCY